jgi:hypothetical protein
VELDVASGVVGSFGLAAGLLRLWAYDACHGVTAPRHRSILDFLRTDHSGVVVSVEPSLAQPAMVP